MFSRLSLIENSVKSTSSFTVAILRRFCSANRVNLIAIIALFHTGPKGRLSCADVLKETSKKSGM